MKALLIEPGQYPKSIELENSLPALQKAVGGYIEVTYPFEEMVGLVMNEEGKLMGLPLNRALYTEEGELHDIVAGPFLAVGLTSDDFRSLTKEEQDFCYNRFKDPEMFTRFGNHIVVTPVPPKKVSQEREENEPEL